MDAGTLSENGHLAFVTVGTARLPKSIAGEQSGPLIVELTLDSDGKRITDIATSLSLPGYIALLRELLVGSHVNDLEAVVQRVAEHYRGPLLR
ncbi:unnamed protein product, partial [marine sediment metagenome]